MIEVIKGDIGTHSLVSKSLEDAEEWNCFYRKSRINIVVAKLLINEVRILGFLLLVSLGT